MNFINLFLILFKVSTVLWLIVGNVEGIVGGSEASIGQYTFMVSIQANNEHVCSGAIVGVNHVITAAHCFIGEDENFKNDKYYVIGKVNIINDRIIPGLKADISSVYVPKEYKRIQSESQKSQLKEVGDLAVIILQNELKFSENSGLSKLNIPKTKQGIPFPTYYNEEALLIGYGGDSVNRGIKRDRGNEEISHENSMKLKAIRVFIIHKTTCNGKYSVPVGNKLFCAQALQQTLDLLEGPFEGDNGGPVVYQDNTIIGVLTDNRLHSNNKLYDGLYTRITAFSSFLSKVVDNKKTSADVRVAVYKTKYGKRVGSSADNAELIEIFKTKN